MKGDPSRLFCGGPQVVAGNGSGNDGASYGPADCACTGVSRVARTVHDPLRCIPESSTPARASSFRTHRRSDRIAGIWHGVALPQSLGRDVLTLDKTARMWQESGRWTSAA